MSNDDRRQAADSPQWIMWSLNAFDGRSRDVAGLSAAQRWCWVALCAFVREYAPRDGTLNDGVQAGRPVPASLRRLAQYAMVSASTMSNAIRALERRGMLRRDRREREPCWHVVNWPKWQSSGGSSSASAAAIPEHEGVRLPNTTRSAPEHESVRLPNTALPECSAPEHECSATGQKCSAPEHLSPDDDRSAAEHAVVTADETSGADVRSPPEHEVGQSQAAHGPPAETSQPPERSGAERPRPTHEAVSGDLECSAPERLLKESTTENGENDNGDDSRAPEDSYLDQSPQHKPRRLGVHPDQPTDPSDDHLILSDYRVLMGLLTELRGDVWSVRQRKHWCTTLARAINDRHTPIASEEIIGALRAEVPDVVERPENWLTRLLAEKRQSQRDASRPSRGMRPVSDWKQRARRRQREDDESD